MRATRNRRDPFGFHEAAQCAKGLARYQPANGGEAEPRPNGGRVLGCTSVKGDLAPSLARTRVALAEAHLERAAAGDRERASMLLALAEAEMRRLGMRALLARAAELTSSLERRPGRLSRREREIAVHVASGMSNREIAEILVLSERTVETHVQNILMKLDLRSRAHIAAWATRSGLAEEHT